MAQISNVPRRYDCYMYVVLPLAIHTELPIRSVVPGEKVELIGPTST